MDVNGASVVVTGGASGLGAATAARLAARGARVVILDLPESQGKAVAEVHNGLFAPADVTDPASVEAALDMAEAQAPLRAVCTAQVAAARCGSSTATATPARWNCTSRWCGST